MYSTCFVVPAPIKRPRISSSIGQKCVCEFPVSVFQSCGSSIASHVGSRTTMRSGRGRPSRKGPSRTPRSKEEAFEKIAAQYGVQKSRAGQSLDEKVRAQVDNGSMQPWSAYSALVDAVGQENLDRAEKGIIFALATVFTAFITTGLAISTQAFFKATGRTVSPGFDVLVDNLQGYFTPALFCFFALSSAFGLYKQAQLTSGATGYSESE